MRRYRYHLVPAADVPLAWMAQAACRWTAAKLDLDEVPPVYFFLPDGDEPVEIARPELEQYVARLEEHIAGGPPPEHFSSANVMLGFTRDTAPGVYVRADLDSFEMVKTALHETIHAGQNRSGERNIGQRERWAEYFERVWFPACFNQLDEYRDDNRVLKSRTLR